MTENVCFVDTETTGLDPDRHEIWEVGLILPDGTEREWRLHADLGRADPAALAIGRFHERRYDVAPTDRNVFSSQFAHLTRGLHLAGAVVSFDEERLRKLLRANGACPEWHYHLIDVENLAVGFLAGVGVAGSKGWLTGPPMPPWNSNDLSLAVGVDPEQFDRHTALGDAKWAKAIYEAVMGR